MSQLRQRDVLLRAIEALPEGASAVTPEGGRFVLAEGEATGHAHAVLADGVQVFERDGTLYLEVRAPAALTHEEHAPLDLAPGFYEVRRQREYKPGPSTAWKILSD